MSADGYSVIEKKKRDAFDNIFELNLNNAAGTKKVVNPNVINIAESMREQQAIINMQNFNDEMELKAKERKMGLQKKAFELDKLQKEFNTQKGAQANPQAQPAQGNDAQNKISEMVTKPRAQHVNLRSARRSYLRQTE
jgi:hypothetical protein